MALLYSQAATASVAANSNSIAVAGMDLAPVLQGMVIYLGARDRVTGDGYIIAGVAPNGSNGGTITTVGALPAFNSAPFVIDTRDFNGSAPNYLIATYTVVLTALLKLTSPLTNLFSGSRVLALDKDAGNAVSRLLYAIGGRIWGALEQRTLTYTPTGSGQVTTESLAIRAYPDGTTPVDALHIDLATGGVDVLATYSTMAATAMVDLSSGPTQKTAIFGAASITSFGPGKNKIRDVVFFNSGSVLIHNSASLILPSQANITIVAGDTLRVQSDQNGAWRVMSFDRTSGKALVPPTPAEVMGFLPVQQGGGPSQAGNKLNLGWGGTLGAILAAVDGASLGKLWADNLAPSSIGLNGYQKLPSGLIIQWGFGTDSNAEYTVTLPITFPSAILCALACQAGTIGINDALATCTDNVTKSSIGIRRRLVSNGGGVGPAYAYTFWLALGY